MVSDNDIHFMRAAISFARRGLGNTRPNPTVGCIIVKDGRIIARGRTAQSGRPHAEAAALERAGPAARGATAYVSLEPCSRPGREGPCAEALVKAGIKRVVAACIDPNPAVNGSGMEILKANGVETLFGVLEEEARDVNRGFFLAVTEKRPLITLKLATARDGNIPESGWITGELARRHGHLERSQHDAILVGIGTVLKDDPLLTTRLEGVKHEIVRIILDSHLKIPLASRLVLSAHDAPLWIFHVDDPEGKADALARAGVKLFPAQGDIGILPAVKAIAREGITRLLVEGGPRVWASFISSGLYDRVLWYRAPGELPDGRPALPPGTDLGFQRIIERKLGQDLLEIYEKQA